MKKAIVMLAAATMLIAGCAFGGVPIKWTVETSRADERVIEVYHGETLDMEVTFKTYGQILELPTNEVAATFWQTNGMDNAYWRTNNVEIIASNGIMRTSFGPEQDVGAKTLRGFIGIAGNIYRAAFVLRFKEAPGYNPTIVEWPYRLLDFQTIEVRNPPYYTKDEADEMVDAIGETIGEVSTNLERKIDAAVSNEHQYAQGVSNKMQIAINQINGKLVDDVILKEGWNNLDSVLHLTRRGQYNRPIISMSAKSGQYEGNSHNLDIALDNGGNWYFNVWDDDEEYDKTIDIPRKNGTMALEEDVNAKVEELVPKSEIMDYEQDPSVPDWAKQQDPPTYTARQVGAIPYTWIDVVHDIYHTGEFISFDNDVEFGELATIRLNTNELYFGGTKYTGVSTFPNDAGYISSEEETDPTVPEWAKEPDPPTAEEVGALSEEAGTAISNKVETLTAYLSGETARYIVKDYGSLDVMPHAHMEIKQNGDWLETWSELTRWNSFLGTNFVWITWYGFADWRDYVENELRNKADRAWGLCNSETGEWSPEGFTQISSSNIIVASGMAYQRIVETGGAVWVLRCNTGAAMISGETNGYFRIMDSEGTVHFEIVKGDEQELGADADGISVGQGELPEVTIPYSVIAEVHPTLSICADLNTPVWKDETDEDCPATVTWSGQSGSYVATVQRKSAGNGLFIRARYIAGGETYIRNNAPVSMSSIMLNGVKYYLGTATISGQRVMTLSTTPTGN